MFCGIDVSKGKSTVCIVDKDKKVLHEFAITHNKDGFDILEGYLSLETKIGMEHTGVYSTALFYYLYGKYNVCFVESTQMHNFAKLHSRYIKNDVIDARLIAEYLSYGFEEIQTYKINELNNISKLYYKMVKQHTRYKTMFRMDLEIIFPELERKFSILRSTLLTLH